jgi:hypothetical protein
VVADRDVRFWSERRRAAAAGTPSVPAIASSRRGARGRERSPGGSDLRIRSGASLAVVRIDATTLDDLEVWRR